MNNDTNQIFNFKTIKSKIKLTPLFGLFICYILGIISFFLPMPYLLGIIFLVPAIVGSVILYIRRIMRIYRLKKANEMLVSEDILKIPEKSIEQIKPTEQIKSVEKITFPEVKYEERPAIKELITIEQIKDISQKAKDLIDDSTTCRKFITKVKLPVSSVTTVNVQITPDIFLVIAVRPDEIVVYRHDPEVVEKKIETQRYEEKKTDIAKSEEIKPEVIKPIEAPKPEPNKEPNPLIIKSPKVTYDTIITTVLRGKGRMKAVDALAQCKKIKDMKQWEKFLPMSNSRFGLPVIFSVVEENGTKVKYIEWTENK